MERIRWHTGMHRAKSPTARFDILQFSWGKVSCETGHVAGLGTLRSSETSNTYKKVKKKVTKSGDAVRCELIPVTGKDPSAQA